MFAYFLPRFLPLTQRTPSLGRRPSSTYVLRNPSPAAPREVPTPLVFVSASEWSGTSDAISQPQGRTTLETLAAMFAEKGFTCLETDISPPADVLVVSDSKILMEYYEAELRTNIRLTSIPFPPVLVSVGVSSLIAQTYASSNPLSGLILISPPASEGHADVNMPGPLEDFNYELTFPIAVMGTPREIDAMRKHHRLGKSAAVDLIEVDDVAGQDAFRKMEGWLESIGI